VKNKRKEVIGRLEALRARLFEALAEAETAWEKMVAVEGELGEAIAILREDDDGKAG